jgi:hypothetical protein
VRNISWKIEKDGENYVKKIFVNLLITNYFYDEEKVNENFA